MRQVLNLKMVRSNYLRRAFWQRLHECPASLLNKVEEKNSSCGSALSYFPDRVHYGRIFRLLGGSAD